jgi:predicted GNAT family acetyltransferase
MSDEVPSVVHEPSRSRFLIAFADGSESYVEYIRRERELELTHTFSPPSRRGQGLAALVVKAAFDFAREEGLRVIPTCSYIPVFVQRNPEYRKSLL